MIARASNYAYYYLTNYLLNVNANQSVARKANQSESSIEATIPATLARLMRIGHGDMLEWDIDILAGERILIIKKLGKPGAGV